MSELAVLKGFDDFLSQPEPLGIIVKSFSEIGSVSSLNFGKVTFTPTEIALMDEQRAAYHVKIEIERPNQHPEIGLAAIPYEEIDRIIAAAHVLARAGSRGVTRMKNFEASVSTADEQCGWWFLTLRMERSCHLLKQEMFRYSSTILIGYLKWPIIF
jgi:hypothetical protein